MARRASPAILSAMAHAGDALVHPTSGQRLIFRRVSAQTDGRLLECDVYYPPNEPPCPGHAHARQEHQVEVIAGSLHASIRSNLHQLQAGDVLLIESDEPHAVWNPTAEL